MILYKSKPHVKILLSIIVIVNFLLLFNSSDNYRYIIKEDTHTFYCNDFKFIDEKTTLGLSCMSNNSDNILIKDTSIRDTLEYKYIIR